MKATANLETSTGKRPKEFTGDRISNLPEEIISHILSLMPTKSAAVTSFLSKRWMLRKTKFTVFNFDDTMWPEKAKHDPEMSFVEFVNMVLLKHGSESIHKFTLLWHLREFQPAYLKIWVDTLIARNVRVLDLDIETDNSESIERYEFTLPTALFSCGTLEVLMLARRFFVRLPAVVCLPKLTVLELFSAKFESDEAFHKLISGCPKLDSLFIERTHFDDSAKVYDICSPTLKSFEMSFYYCDCFEDLGSDELKVKIDAPALESLVLGSDVEVEFSIVSPASVQKVELNLEYPDVGSIVEFVQKFDCSRFLSLSPGTMTLLSSAPDQLSTGFQRLTSLSVHFTAAQWGCLLNVVSCCIKLQVLELTMVSSREKGYTGGIATPRCFSSSLRRVSFSDFNGLEDEISILNFILQQGLLLETVTLRSSASSSISCDQKLQIQNNVLQLSRASPVCKISFSWAGRGCPRIGENL